MSKTSRGRSVVRALVTRAPFVEPLEMRSMFAATPTGSLPTGYVPVKFKIGPIAADHTRNRVYITDTTNKQLRIVDTDQAKQVGSVPLTGTDIEGITVAPDGSSVVIAYYDSKTLQVIDPKGMKSLRTISTGITPVGIAIGAGGMIYVSPYDYGGATTAFNLTTGKAGATLADNTGDFLQTDATGTRLYVTNSGYAHAVSEYDIHDAAHIKLLRTFDTDASNLLSFVADRTADRIFLADGPVYGLGFINMTRNREANTLFDDPIFNEGMDSVEGKPTFFVRSTDYIYEFQKSTGTALDRYVAHGNVARNSLAETPNGRAIYISDPGDDGAEVGIIGASAVSFSDQSTMTVSGTVFSDTDLDGVHDRKERSFPSVGLYIDLNHNGRLDSTRDGDDIDEPNTETSDSDLDGSFQLEIPAAGTYTLVAQRPSFGNFNDPIVTTKSVMRFKIAKGQHVTGLDIGVAFQGLTVLNFYGDIDGDGVRDANEAAATAKPDLYIDLNHNAKLDAGEPFQRYAADAAFDDPTHYSGEAYFNVAPGTYDVRTLDKSDVLTTNAATQITLASNDRQYLDVGVSVIRTLTGRLFKDLDADGVRDASEPDYGGVLLWLDLDGDGHRDHGEPASITKPNGRYSMPSAGPVNGAAIRFSVGDAKLVSTATRRRITLTGEQLTARYDAGVYLPAVVTVSTYLDVNANRKRNKGDRALAGVIVFIDLDDDGRQDRNELSAITDAQGNATFTGLANGTYVLRARVPSKFKATTATRFSFTAAPDAASRFDAGMH